MRKIKFRARELGGGFLYAEIGQIYSIPHSEKYLDFIVDGCSYTVIADSLAIRVGYDEAGNEVYEGDTYLEEDGTVHTAEFKELRVFNKISYRPLKETNNEIQNAAAQN